MLHRLAIALELAQVGYLALNDAEVDRHLHGVKRAADDGQEQRGDSADADANKKRHVANHARILGAEEITRVSGIRRCHRRESSRGNELGLARLRDKRGVL